MGILLGRRRGLHACAVLGVSLCLLAGLATTATAGGTKPHRAVCDRTNGSVACQSLVIVAADNATPQATSYPDGLSPATIRSAYGFSTDPAAGAGTTIAIVDAFNAPTIQHDLGVFSTQFGLPACTTANGCFKKVDAQGGHTYPAASPGWALETSIDVEWAHAIAPGARILLVEASSNTMSALFTAVDYAKNHAQYVSMSWGTTEFKAEVAADKHFLKPGVSFFAAAGDDGVPALYPATSPRVIAVGGTYLDLGTHGLNGEYGWSDGGGGCSRFEVASPEQATFSQYPVTTCLGKRATPDLSLDASPNSGVSVYDSTTVHQTKGWFTMGGTSLATPMVAARAAVGGTPIDQAAVYGGAISYRDITQGNNGAACAVGYELCTGRGSWIGS